MKLFLVNNDFLMIFEVAALSGVAKLGMKFNPLFTHVKKYVLPDSPSS